MKTSLRFLSHAVLFAAVGLALTAGPSLGQNVSFTTRSIYNNLEPGLVPPGSTNTAGRIVIYNLPATGTVPNYFGPVESVPFTVPATFHSRDIGFNVRAQVQGGGVTPQQVAAYGVIMEVSGGGEVVFTTPDPNPSGTPNNMANVKGTGTTQNAGLSIILGETNVDGFAGAGRSLGVVGLHPTADVDTTVVNGDGLFFVPLRVGGGVTGNFNLSLALGGDVYSGFGQSDGDIVTNAANFAHVSNIIEVRRSRQGDTNGDVLIDGEDINGFIEALSGFQAYKSARPWLRAEYVIDVNQDGAVDGEDINPFVQILSNPGGSPSGSPAAIPEPSSLALAAIGATTFMAMRIRRRKAAQA